MSDETENTEPVREGHNDDALLDDGRRICVRPKARVSPRMKVDHHREPGARHRRFRCENVQVEAVFAPASAARPIAGNLYAWLGELGCVTDTVPLWRRSWCTPTQRAYGRSGIRNSAPLADRSIVDPPQIPTLRVHDEAAGRIRRSMRHEWSRQDQRQGKHCTV